MTVVIVAWRTHERRLVEMNFLDMTIYLKRGLRQSCCELYGLDALGRFVYRELPPLELVRT